MSISWHPVCPCCREPYLMYAFDGDRRGPLHPLDQALGDKHFKCPSCKGWFTVYDVRAWEHERLGWRAGDDVPLRVTDRALPRS